MKFEIRERGSSGIYERILPDSLRIKVRHRCARIEGDAQEDVVRTDLRSESAKHNDC
jgi:hypothetical protein